MNTSLREQLLSTYGPVMDAKALCKVLCYPSVAALMAAKSRGRVLFPMVELEGRRGYFGLTEQIAAYIESAFQVQAPTSADCAEKEKL